MGMQPFAFRLCLRIDREPSHCPSKSQTITYVLLAGMRDVCFCFLLADFFAGFICRLAWTAELALFGGGTWRAYVIFYDRLFLSFPTG